MDTRCHTGLRRGEIRSGPAGGVASRKPLLSLRLAPPFLLRLAARTLAGLLFQAPPRTTRLPLPGLGPPED